MAAENEYLGVDENGNYIKHDCQFKHFWNFVSTDSTKSIGILKTERCTKCGIFKHEFKLRDPRQSID